MSPRLHKISGCFVFLLLLFRPIETQALISMAASKNPIVVELGVKDSFHYNFQKLSILTPPRILYAGALVGYLMDGWLMGYAEIDASISKVTARSIFMGVKFLVLNKKFANTSAFHSIWLSLNVDYGLISIENPTPPDAYIPSEFLPRLGGSMIFLLGKGKTFVNATSYVYNQSTSNLMLNVGLNFGFLVY